MLIEKVRVEVLGVSPLPDQLIVPLFFMEKFMSGDTVERCQNSDRDAECKELHASFRPHSVKQPVVYFDLVTYHNKRPHPYGSVQVYEDMQRHEKHFRAHEFFLVLLVDLLDIFLNYWVRRCDQKNYPEWEQKVFSFEKQGEGQDHDESVEEVGGDIPEKGGLPELILLFGF